MDSQILQKLEQQNEKIDALAKTVNKLQKYFMATFWITVVLFVIPLVAIVFIVPSFLDGYVSSLDGLI